MSKKMRSNFQNIPIDVWKIILYGLNYEEIMQVILLSKFMHETIEHLIKRQQDAYEKGRIGSKIYNIFNNEGIKFIAMQRLLRKAVSTEIVGPELLTQLLNNEAWIIPSLYNYAKQINSECCQIIERQLSGYKVISKTEEIGKLPLYISSEKLQVFSQLLEQGNINLQAKDKYGDNALTLIARQPTLLPILSAKFENLPQALQKKLNQEKQEILNIILKAKVKLKPYNSNHSITAISYYLLLEEAVKDDKHDIIRILNKLHVPFGPELLRISKNNTGQILREIQAKTNAMIIAISYRENLVISNQDLNNINLNLFMNGNSICHKIAEYNCKNVVRKLRCYIDTDIRSCIGQTPLDIALEKNHLNIFQKLLQIQSNLEGKAVDNLLYKAVRLRNPEAVKLLLKYKYPNVNLKINGKLTLIEYARHNEDEEIVELLKGKGAKDKVLEELEDNSRPEKKHKTNESSARNC